MTLREFIKTYNFRSYFNEKENTQIIRIIDNFEDMWFEFGIKDWRYPDERDKYIEFIFNKELLDRNIMSIQYGETTEVVEIHIDETEIS